MISHFDSPDLLALVQDLMGVEGKLVPEVRKVVERGALNVKKDAQQRFQAQSSGTYLPHYAASITYEMTGPLEAEVGPERTGHKQGQMGRGIEFGSSNKGPMPHMIPAADAEEPKLADQVGDAAVRVLR